MIIIMITNILRVVFPITSLFFSHILCSNELEGKAPGDLLHSWTLEFEFFTTSLKGSIIECKDNKGNNLVIRVITKYSHEGYLNIRYNSYFNEKRLSELCGCTKCNYRMTYLLITLKDDSISTQCNHYRSMFFYIKHYRYGNHDYSNVVTNFIVGSSRNTGGDFLVGCLKKLAFKETRMIEFRGKEHNVKKRCDDYCMYRLCTTMPIIVKNDSKSTFATTSFDEYISSGNNSYEIISHEGVIKVRLTWNHDFEKSTCLLELVLRKYGSIMISTENSNLMVATFLFRNLSNEKPHFVDVTISDKIIIIEAKEDYIEFDSSLLSVERINIGFGERCKQCKTLHGKYEFKYNETQIRKTLYTGLRAPRCEISLRSNIFITSITNKFLILYYVISSIGLLIFLFKTIFQFKSCDSKISNATDSASLNSHRVDIAMKEKLTQKEVYSLYSNLDEQRLHSPFSSMIDGEGSYLVQNGVLSIDEGPPLPPRDNYENI